jgi:hypothetical protein
MRATRGNRRIRLRHRPGGQLDAYRVDPIENAEPLALPEEGVMARPTGVGRAITTCSMSIEGRDEWLAAAVRHLA